jgi:hypothetical protein
MAMFNAVALMAMNPHSGGIGDELLSGKRVKGSRGGRAQRSGALNALPAFWGMQGLP